MLARRLRWLLGLELLAYALLLRAALVGAWPLPLAVACIAFAHVALRCGVVPLGVLVATMVEPRGSVAVSGDARSRAAPTVTSAGARRPLGVVRGLAVLVRECRALWWNYVLAPFEPWLAHPSPAAAFDGRGDADVRADPQSIQVPQIVLVHGILCNAVVWRPFAKALARRGWATRAVTLEPVLGSIDAMAETLATALRDVPGPILVVAHSMGGLVTRRLLQCHPELPIHGVITIGTPHAGAAQASLAVGEAARCMCGGSDWLARLAAADPSARPVRRLSIRSLHDELVSPSDSARWPGARELALDGVGHVALLADERVITEVLGEIEALARRERPAGRAHASHDAGDTHGALR